jgi:hypothetical protein
MSTTELHWQPATTPPDADTGGLLEGVTHWAEPEGPKA